MSDMVAMADAKILLTAGMVAVLVEVGSPDILEEIFRECMEEAAKGYSYELNQPLFKGTAATREHWQRMIMKLLRVFGTGQKFQEEVRSFFELMMTRAVARVDEEKLNRAKEDPKISRQRDRAL